MVTTLNYFGAKDIGVGLADTNYGPILSEITDMSGFIKRYQSTLLTYVLTGDPLERAKTEERIQVFEDSHENLDALTTLSEEKALQTKVRAGFAQVIQEGSTLINLYDTGATGGEIAAQAKVFKKSVGVGRRAIDTFRDVQLTKLENTRTETISSVNNSINLGFMLGGISLILAIGLGLFIYRSISAPIARLKDAAIEIAKGNLDARIETKTKDELGVLTLSFNQMSEDLRKSRHVLEGQTQRLARSNAELEQFAFIATHDLQEPLRKVQAFGDLLANKSSGALDEQSRGYLDRMRDAAARMRTLINDLLSFSRVSSQVQPYAPVDLGRLTQEVLSDLEPLIAETGGRVDVGDLPTIDADPTQMRQLQQNLIGNAPQVPQTRRSTAGKDSWSAPRWPRR